MRVNISAHCSLFSLSLWFMLTTNPKHENDDGSWIFKGSAPNCTYHCSIGNRCKTLCNVAKQQCNDCASLGKCDFHHNSAHGPHKATTHSAYAPFIHVTSFSCLQLYLYILLPWSCDIWIVRIAKYTRAITLSFVQENHMQWLVMLSDCSKIVNVAKT